MASTLRLFPRALHLAVLPRAVLPRTVLPRAVLPRALYARFYAKSAAKSAAKSTSPTTVAPTTTKKYTYPSICSLPSSTILIDVREPAEFTAGAIPGAINLPLMTAPEALSLPADEFEDRFGIQKPPKDCEVVFYCKAGVRSAAAAQMAVMEGYEKVGEYPGSWMDWVKSSGGEGEGGVKK